MDITAIIPGSPAEQSRKITALADFYRSDGVLREVAHGLACAHGDAVPLTVLVAEARALGVTVDKLVNEIIAVSAGLHA